MQLTDAQLKQFHQDGYLHLKHFLEPEKCDAILEVAKVHLAHRIEPIETESGYSDRSKTYRTEVADYASMSQEPQTAVRRLRQVYDRDILFKEWMEDVSLRPVLQQILEDEVVVTTGHHNSIMTKMPYVSRATGWHQDRRYWRYSDDNLVSVWLALGDECSDNGSLEFIPGSHTMHFEPEQFDEKEYFKEDTSQNAALIAHKVLTVLQKGDVILFHSLLLHRANKNSTDEAKIAFVYTVKGARTKAEAGSRSAQFPEIRLEKIVEEA